MGSAFLHFALWHSLLPKRTVFDQFSFFQKHFMKISFFWQKTASKSKIQESRPCLEFNFTACSTSPYPLGPFLKLGNGMVWFWSYFYTFLPSNQQFRPPKRWASWFVWKCENDNEDDMDKNGLSWEENDYVKMNICVQINGL